MQNTQKAREKQKVKQATNLLFIALTVCMIGYAIFISSIFEACVGKAVTNYEITDTSITVDLHDYKYAIVKGFITDKVSGKIDTFSYGTESDTIFYEEILMAEGAGEDAEVSLAKSITVSNWYHPWLHEPIFVLGTLLLFVIPIPFCVAINRIDQVEKPKEHGCPG